MQIWFTVKIAWLLLTLVSTNNLAYVLAILFAFYGIHLGRKFQVTPIFKGLVYFILGSSVGGCLLIMANARELSQYHDMTSIYVVVILDLAISCKMAVASLAYIKLAEVLDQGEIASAKANAKNIC